MRMREISKLLSNTSKLLTSFFFRFLFQGHLNVQVAEIRIRERDRRKENHD